jgi:hypothetical protein
MTKPKPIELRPEAIPVSGLDSNGKLKIETEDERGQRLESARRRLQEIADIPDEPDDPPDKEWMRGIDELCPHRPVFKGCMQVDAEDLKTARARLNLEAEFTPARPYKD